MELKQEGIYIAQGPENNVLIKIVGKAPMLEVAGAIDLNHFYKTGEAKNLSKTSDEVLDILSCPEKYNFEYPSFTEAVKSEGIDRSKGKSIDIENIPDDDFQTYAKEYKNLHGYLKPDEAERKFIMWLRQKHNISINNGHFIVKKIKAYFQNRQQ